jgi:hypothetical protein
VPRKLINSPLTNDHLERLNRVLKSCAEIREVISRCKDCGLTVDREEKLNDEQEKVASKIKENFFPDSV